MILTTQLPLRDAKHEPGLQFRCGDCGKVNDVQTAGGTGYAYYEDDGYNKPICYACCGKRDGGQMVKDGKATLYLDAANREVGNWPGTLKFKLTQMWHGGVRGRTTNVEFIGPDGRPWKGCHRGGGHQLINVKRKGK